MKNSSSIHAVATLLVMAISLLPPQSLAQPETLGRLFSTPLERAILDRMRISGETGLEAALVVDQQPDWVEDEESAAETERIPDHLEIILTGSLQRGNDDFTLWINHQPVSQAELPASMKAIKLDHLVALQISYSGGSIVIKPGQRFHPATGSVTDLLLTPPPPPPVAATSETASNTSTAAVDDVPVITPSGPAAVILMLRDVMRYLQ